MGDIVTALYDFETENEGELGFQKDEKLIVIEWDKKEGWAYGYKYSDISRMGIFPQTFVKKELNHSKLDNENDDIAIALFDFETDNEGELKFKKDDKIRVIDWEAKEGWAYGYINGDISKKGLFPQTFVKKEMGDIAIALFDFETDNEGELKFKKDDKIRVIDWEAKEGWAYGYINGDISKKGLFPQTFVKK
eukprot:jgi/Orpsp1_1/1187430/evm.model.d7180000057645.1